MQDRLDLAVIEANLVKLQNESTKLLAETTKLNRESKWLPFWYGAGFMGALAALIGAVITLTKLFL